MTDKIDQELRDKLCAVLAGGVSDEGMKALKKQTDHILADIQSDIEWRLKDELAPALCGWTIEMAERAIEQILKGNEDQMRRYLSCEKSAEDGEYIGWTGRSDGKYWGRQREQGEWHSVIHGTLFEQGAVELRHKIAEAHKDLIQNERIRDLEDQVASLIAQVNKANAEKEEMWQRMRGAA